MDRRGTGEPLRDADVTVVVALYWWWLEPRHNAQLQFLREQIRILRSRVDAERIVPTPEERAELLRIGALLNHDVADLMHVVRPATYHRWRREQRGGYVPKKTGRPPTAVGTTQIAAIRDGNPQIAQWPTKCIDNKNNVSTHEEDQKLSRIHESLDIAAPQVRPLLVELPGEKGASGK